MHRRILPSFLAAVTLAAGAHAQSAATPEQIKAAMIEKLSRFVEWPGAAPPRFSLCVSPDHPLLPAIREYYDNVVIGERPVDVQVLKRADVLSGCRAAVIATKDGGELARVRASAEREHVLLFAEGAQATQAGVHIGLYTDRNQPVFAINRRTLEASGLKAGYQILERAKVVQ